MINATDRVVGKASACMGRLGTVVGVLNDRGKRVFDVLWDGSEHPQKTHKRSIEKAVAHAASSGAVASIQKVRTPDNSSGAPSGCNKSSLSDSDSAENCCDDFDESASDSSEDMDEPVVVP